MHYNIDPSNAILLQEKVSYSAISLFQYSLFQVLLFPNDTCSYSYILTLLNQAQVLKTRTHLVF